jgi:oligoendopeptidase F
MSSRWSLNELYTSFDSSEFTADMKKFDDYINTFKGWASENLKDTNDVVRKIEDYIRYTSDFYSLYIRLDSFAGLTLSTEAKNERASAVSEELDNKATELTEVEVNFEKWLGGLDNLDELVEKSDVLKEHEFYL